MQRPIELCQWDDLEALPPVGEEYQQRYKLVNDRLPKVRQRLHRAAEYRRGAQWFSGKLPPEWGLQSSRVRPRTLQLDCSS
ncbi:hypothetical protein HaLaN_06694 [Haematococcus lacustris]|uniref:Uncharacterized protein n=1 Tax=Haematococcus lacustris TaxID=44745 RepID=A0A699YPP4_HAELA|nr:hypothetical protein HaLaN_06694 [Haematococcus lacustris]